MGRADTGEVDGQGGLGTSEGVGHGGPVDEVDGVVNACSDRELADIRFRVDDL